MKFITRVQVLFLLGALQTLVSATAAPQVDAAVIERSLESVPSTQVVDKRTLLVGADPVSAVLGTAGGLVGSVLNTAGGIVNGVLGGAYGGTTVVGGPTIVGGGGYVPVGSGSSYSYESHSCGGSCKKRFAKVRRAAQVEEVESA